MAKTSILSVVRSFLRLQGRTPPTPASSAGRSTLDDVEMGAIVLSAMCAVLCILNAKRRILETCETVIRRQVRSLPCHYTSSCSGRQLLSSLYRITQHMLIMIYASEYSRCGIAASHRPKSEVVLARKNELHPTAPADLAGSDPQKLLQVHH